MSEAASNMNEDDAKAPSRELAEKTSTEDNAKDKEPAEADSFVKLEFKLVDWSYMVTPRVLEARVLAREY